MQLEDAIKTRKFTSEHHRLRVNLLYTSHWLEGELKAVLAPHGISRKQFNVLRILRGHTGEIPLSVLDIKERMIDATSDASRMIERMAKKGLLKRYPCTVDKRVTRISILQPGLDLLAAIDIEKEKLDNVLDGISPDEAKQLNALLDKLRS
jgi:DNA-binding MarR family transcriptional regulator